MTFYNLTFNKFDSDSSMLLTHPCSGPAARPGVLRRADAPSRLHPSRGALQYRFRALPKAARARALTGVELSLLGTQTDRVPCFWDRFMRMSVPIPRKHPRRFHRNRRNATGYPARLALWLGPIDTLLRNHRHWMTTGDGRAVVRSAKSLSDPTLPTLGGYPC